MRTIMHAPDTQSTQVGTSGVWECFAPKVASGAAYKFHIRGADGEFRFLLRKKSQ